MVDLEISNPLEYSKSKSLIKGVIFAFIVLTTGVFILILLNNKTKDNNPPKAFSYKIATFFLGILFICFIIIPVKRLLINKPADNKTVNEETIETKAFIKKFLEEHAATDSITNFQIKSLKDSLDIE